MSAIVIAGALFSMAGSMSKGISALNESTRLANDVVSEGRTLQQESLRTAAIIQEEGAKFASAQSLQYISSGVHIAGSALITIAQTKTYAKEEADAVRAKGRAQLSLAYSKATGVRNEGRAALVSGWTEAAGTGISTAASLHEAKAEE